MKKAIAYLLAVLLILPVLCLGASAEETEEYTDPYDSRAIPRSIMETHEYKSSETALRVYTWNLFDYDDYDNIDDLVANCYSVYLVQSSNEWLKYNVENGSAHETGLWEYAAPYINYDAINAFSSDISIESIYYFYSSYYAVVRCAIYYKTNMGDYVYFATPEYGLMLMRADRYFEFVRKWIKYQKWQNFWQGTLFGGEHMLHEDWSVYYWDSPNFDPDAPLPGSEDDITAYIWLVGGAVVLVGIVVVGIVVTRKRKKEEEEIFEDT